MNLTTILEARINVNHRDDWPVFLHVQRILVERHFDWLKLRLDSQSRSLIGKGELELNGKRYQILLSYSPFNEHRYDQIFIVDKNIEYHRDIHLYGDMSLCLYHPVIDVPKFQTLPLFKIIPWISEWIVFYEQWKKFGVWLGKEIKH